MKTWSLTISLFALALLSEDRQVSSALFTTVYVEVAIPVLTHVVVKVTALTQLIVRF